MLKQLRDKKTSKKIWIGLALIVVPLFIFWGAGGIGKGSKKANIAGKLYGKPVSFQEYEDALIATRNQAVIQFGEMFSQMQKYMNMESQTWDRLILLHEAAKRKIRANDQDVIKLIKSYPFFQKKGVFDKALYKQMLQYYFHTPARAFEEETRQNIMIARLYDEITQPVKLTEEEIKNAYIKTNQEISVYYICSAPQEFTKYIQPNQDELKSYYDKNKLEFKQPLSFNLEYIILPFTADTKTAVEEKINGIMPRIKAKEDLNKVAKDLKLEVKETGLFPQTGPIPGIGWPKELLELISRLKTNDYTQVFSIESNYYIFRIKERKESYVPDFEEIKDKVRDRLIKEESQNIAEGKIKEALTQAETEYKTNPKSLDLSKIAKGLGLKYAETTPFKYGSYIEGIGSSDSFWDVADALEDNQPSKIIGMSSGFYIIKIKSRSKLDETKFKEEKAAFSEQLLNQKKQEAFLKFLEEAKKKAQIY